MGRIELRRPCRSGATNIRLRWSRCNAAFWCYKHLAPLEPVRNEKVLGSLSATFERCHQTLHCDLVFRARVAWRRPDRVSFHPASRAFSMTSSGSLGGVKCPSSDGIHGLRASSNATLDLVLPRAIHFRYSKFPQVGCRLGP